MNAEPDNGSPRAGLMYGLAVMGAFLIVAMLVWAMRQYVQPAPLNAERAAERARALAELKAAEAEALQSTGWIDPGRGVVRLRIEDAIGLMLREWEHPAAARSNLLARLERAVPATPPAAPAEPSPFE